jgi:uncharacterized membrane protein
VSHFDSRKQRLLALFVWGPVGLVLFGVGGVLLIRAEWGLTDGRVIAGAATGVALMAPLAVIGVLRHRRRLTPSELREVQTAFAQRDNPNWPAWTLYAIMAFSVALGLLIETAFGAALIFTVMTLTTVMAWIVAFTRQGVFQDSDQRSVRTPEPG